MSAYELSRNSQQDRKLRRAAADLANCTIEDIEAIWAELTPMEQSQLQPLLAEATLLSGTIYATSTLGQQADFAAANKLQPNATQELASVVKALPKELAVRALNSLEPVVQTQVSTLLSDEKRIALEKIGGSFTMTAAARQALREAVLHLARDVVIVEPAATLRSNSMTDNSTSNWRGRLQRWMGMSTRKANNL